MFCEYCGRNIINSKCACVKSTRIRKVEAILLYMLVYLFPLTAIVFFYKQSPILVVSFSMSFLIIIISIIGFLLDKPYLALLFYCHQKINRTIFLFSNPLPICARCTGILLGIFTLPIICLVFEHIPWYLFLISSLPIILDGFIQLKYKKPSNNFKRLITGFFFGFTLIYLLTIYNELIIRVAVYITTII